MIECIELKHSCLLAFIVSLKVYIFIISLITFPTLGPLPSQSPFLQFPQFLRGSPHSMAHQVSVGLSASFSTKSRHGAQVREQISKIDSSFRDSHATVVGGPS